MAMSEWISVKDRLPAAGVEVIALSPKFNEYMIGQVKEHSVGIVCEFEDFILCDVTHWMPLPEPPVEE